MPRVPRWSLHQDFNLHFLTPEQAQKLEVLFRLTLMLSCFCLQELASGGNHRRFGFEDGQAGNEAASGGNHRYFVA